MSSIYKTETAIVSPAREAAFMQKCTTINVDDIQWSSDDTSKASLSPLNILLRDTEEEAT